MKRICQINILIGLLFFFIARNSNAVSKGDFDQSTCPGIYKEAPVAFTDIEILQTQGRLNMSVKNPKDTLISLTSTYDEFDNFNKDLNNANPFGTLLLCIDNDGSDFLYNFDEGRTERNKFEGDLGKHFFLMSGSENCSVEKFNHQPSILHVIFSAVDLSDGFPAIKITCGKSTYKKVFNNFPKLRDEFYDRLVASLNKAKENNSILAISIYKFYRVNFIGNFCQFDSETTFLDFIRGKKDNS